MMETCEDCFNEFKPQNKHQKICNDCLQLKYSRDQCIHIWKICCSTGFKTQEHLDEYQSIKIAYKLHTGREPHQITEKVGRKK